MATPALRESECTLIAYSGCFHHSRLFMGFLTLERIDSVGIGEFLRGRGIGNSTFRRTGPFRMVITRDESWFYFDYSCDHICACATDNVPQRASHRIQFEKLILTVL
jgi:hypothetical protein